LKTPGIREVFTENPGGKVVIPEKIFEKIFVRDLVNEANYLLSRDSGLCPLDSPGMTTKEPVWAKSLITESHTKQYYINRN